MELAEEKELVARARHDPEAFGQLFEEYYDRILNYALRRIGNVDIAKDIASETFVKALKKLWQFQWRNIPFSAWLYRIALNEIRGMARATARHREQSLTALLDDHGFEPQDSHDLHEELVEAQTIIERHETFLAVQKHMKTLPIHYQEALSLRFFEEKSVLEIAAILGKKEGTVKSLLSRGVAQLRENIVRNQERPPSL